MIRRSTLALIVLAGAVSVAMFSVKYRVQVLEGKLRKIDSDILHDRKAIEVLHAEWSHLNDPARLRQLATQYLGMVPVNPDHVRTISGIDDVIAFRDPQSQLAARGPNPGTQRRATP